MIKTVFRIPQVVKFINDAKYRLIQQRIKSIASEKLRIELLIYPPDKRKRDIDNVCKAILDVLQSAGIFDDDFHIWQLHVERREVRPNGEVEFTLSEIK